MDTLPILVRGFCKTCANDPPPIIDKQTGPAAKLSVHIVGTRTKKTGLATNDVNTQQCALTIRTSYVRAGYTAGNLRMNAWIRGLIVKESHFINTALKGTSAYYNVSLTRLFCFLLLYFSSSLFLYRPRPSAITLPILILNFMNLFVLIC